MDLLGIGQANCFRIHNELTMGLLGKCPLAPSEGHSVRKQRCIRSLGRIKWMGPYWTTATGVRHGRGELQLLELGSRSNSTSSRE